MPDSGDIQPSYETFGILTFVGLVRLCHSCLDETWGEALPAREQIAAIFSWRLEGSVEMKLATFSMAHKIRAKMRKNPPFARSFGGKWHRTMRRFRNYALDYLMAIQSCPVRK
jgi:hypothetical protein